MKRTILNIFIGVVSLNIVLLADGQELFQTCAGCHGEKGEISALQQSKRIGGQEQNLTIKQLTAYKYGELDQYGLGNIMKLQLSTIAKDDIKELAIYIEELDRNSSK